MKPIPIDDPESSYQPLEKSALSLATAFPMAQAADAEAKRRTAAETVQSRAFPIPQGTTAYGMRRSSSEPAQTAAYPLLLVASTAMAAVFCFLYITKPVIPIAPTLAIKPNAAITSPSTGLEKSPAPAASMIPNSERLPGDAGTPLSANSTQHSNPRHALPGTTSGRSFEETNVQIQHVLTAESSSGDLSRIVLNVPVLYQSRVLAWTESEVAESRELLKRLSAYQENTRLLRAEGSELLATWNRLIERSIPAPALRADSPSLPANQDDDTSAPNPQGLDTTESIQIQSAEK